MRCWHRMPACLLLRWILSLSDDIPSLSPSFGERKSDPVCCFEGGAPVTWLEFALGWNMNRLFNILFFYLRNYLVRVRVFSNSALYLLQKRELMVWCGWRVKVFSSSLY